MRIALFLVSAALGAGLPAAPANHDTALPPVGAGLFGVACSNVEQDPALIAALGSTPAEIWEGQPRDGQGRYLTQVLSAPEAAVRFDAPVPDLREIYPRFAGGSFPFVAIVCHPTPASNADPDYVLPGTGDVVPRMLPPGAAPRLLGLSEYRTAIGYPEAGRAQPAELPLVVFSHGLGGSPISPGYLEALVDLASQGFVVAAVFHGDGRFSRLRLEDLGDAVYLLTRFDEFVEMELMRPVALKAMTDLLLAHPYYSAAIDAGRIGGFGASMGGQAMANLLGARLTTSVGLACRETVRDPRIKAAVGLVPYAGQTYLPSFCDDQGGGAEVSRPYLAIAGTADTTAPLKMVEQALDRFRGSRYLVALDGVKHEYLPSHRDDVMTWTVTFLRAYLGTEVRAWESAATVASLPPAARLARMGSVDGGPADSLRVDVHVSSASGDLFTDPLAVEFHNELLDHYFITAWPGEAEGIDRGAAGPGWRRTGQAFRVSPWGAPPGAPVCRFYGRPAGGPNSHFFTADRGECDWVKVAGGWFYEGDAFWAVPPGPGGSCPAGMRSVLRAYNDGYPARDSNHRYTTSNSTAREMQRNGWRLEGTVMCSAL